MKAAYITETGSPDNIIYGEIPDPILEDNQCQVEVHAVSINPIDTYIRSGMIPMELPNPFVVGCDLAGTVVAVGKQVKRFKPGDRVWGTNQGLLGRQGTFSELASVDECWLYPTPDKVEDEVVAAISLVGITAHLGLVGRAQLKAGDILFVNGGTGGVGSTVVQMAKALGATVITTGGSDEKVLLCKELGADFAINYKTENVAEAIRGHAPQGVDVWWETLREPDFDKTVDLLAENGQMILMAGRDARPEFPVGPFYVKGCSLHGFAMFNASANQQREAAEDINNWLNEGKITPKIDRILPLSQAAAGHKLQEESTIHQSGALAGKIVLRP